MSRIIAIKDVYLIDAYREAEASLNRTAKILNVSRPTLYRIINSNTEIKRKLDEVKIEVKKAIKETRYNVELMVFDKVSKKGALVTDKMRKILNETRGKHTSIFDLAIDQLSLRTLMDEIKISYTKKTDEVNLKEYIYIMMNLHKTYAIVTKTAEDIALRKLEGKTPTQFYDEAYNFFRTVFETFKELINDEGINRGDIIQEFCERIDWQIGEE